MSLSTFWQCIPGSAVDVAVGPDGSTWITGSDESIYRWTGAGFSKVPGQGRRIAVGSSDRVWIVGSTGRLFRRDGQVLTEIQTPDGAQDVAVGPGGAVWITGNGCGIFRFTGAGFTQIEGAGTRITIGPDDQPYVLGSNGLVYRRSGEQWREVAIPAGRTADLGVGADGTLWIAGTDGHAYRFDSGSGQLLASTTPVTAISVGPDGLAWVIRSGGAISRQVGCAVPASRGLPLLNAPWVYMNGGALDIAVSPEGSAWVIGSDQSIWECNGTSWNQYTGGGTRIAVGPRNQVWVVNSARQLWRLDGFQAWSKLLVTDACDIGVGADGTAWLVRWDGWIGKWDGQAFTAVSGLARRVAVDPYGQAVVVGTDGRIYRRSGADWVQFPSAAGWAEDVGIGVDGTVWVAGTDGQAYRLDLAAGTFTAAGAAARAIAVAPDGTAWVAQPDLAVLHQVPSAIPSPGRDFVMSLYDRYLGREASPAEVERHFSRLLGGTTRGALEAELRGTEAARAHSGFYDYDFVNSLFQRYLARAPSGADEFFFHVNRLIDNALTHDAMEQEFRCRPEALARPVVPDVNFVWALCWLYLGRAPTAEEQALYVARLAGVLTSRPALEEEIRTCPEALQHGGGLLIELVRSLYRRHMGRLPTDAELTSHAARLRETPVSREALEEQWKVMPEAVAYRSALAPLQILGAAYTGMPAGQEDVTATVGTWAHEDQLSKTWSPQELGTSGDSRHVLIIVYRYGSGPARIVGFPTGIKAVITARADERLQTEPPSSSSALPLAPQQLTILGAMYGRADVTGTACKKAGPEQLFDEVSDQVWGSPGPSDVYRHLTVVYQIGSGPPMLVVVPSETRAYIGAAVLQILGAAYGTVDVTARIATLARRSTLDVVAGPALTSQVPWPPALRTLTVVYRYGDGPARTAVVAEGQSLSIRPDAVPDGTLVPLSPEAQAAAQRGLNILGASFGLVEVTAAAQARCQSHLLRAVADSASWGEGWAGVAKTLAVVYQIDGGRPLVATAAQDSLLALGAPVILGAAYGPLDVTDTVAALVRTGQLAIPVNSVTFPDSFSGTGKALLVVYRYADEPPRVAIAGENTGLFLSTEPPVGTFPAVEGLRILGAAYGLLDLTDAAPIRDPGFIRSLFWQYLGREPSAEDIAAHMQLLVNRTYTRASLEIHFRDCEEAARHRRFADRDFVVSLFTRYLGREPSVPELEAHFDLLFTNRLTREAMEAQLQSSPSALAHGPVRDIDFVTSLYWRSLGRAPDSSGLAWHLSRLTGGSPSPTNRQALTDEFMSCFEGRARAHLLDRDLIVALHWRYLGRAPDEAGISSRLTRILNAEVTREVLATELRVCIEAQRRRAAQPFSADETVWGDGWPGITRKTLAVVYQIGNGPPGVATATQGERLPLPSPAPLPTAYIEAEIRLLADYQVVAPAAIPVKAAGIVVPCGGASPALPVNGAGLKPQKKSVYQVVLMPRRSDGFALPTGARLTLLAEEGVALLSDQPGQTTRYLLDPGVPLQLAVPTSGRCRFAIEPIADRLTCPLLRARWDEMPENLWAVIAPDQDLHDRLADTAPEQLLRPSSGRSSPLLDREYALAVPRAHLFKSSVTQAASFLAQTQLRLRLPDGSLRVAQTVAPVAPAATGSATGLPAHVLVPQGASCTRGILTGAAARAQARQALSATGPVTFGLFDDIADAFSSAASAIGTTFSSAFHVVIGGLDLAVSGTLEGLNAFVSVAERTAQTVAGFSDDQYRQAKCLVIDGTNGLVGYAVLLINSAPQLFRIAVNTVEDAARMITACLKRLAIETWQIIEFLLMFLSWGDVLETQQYLAQAVNIELDQLATLLPAAASQVRALCDRVVLQLPGATVARPAPRSTPPVPRIPVLGDAFSFLFDRIESFSAALPGLALAGALTQTLTSPELNELLGALAEPSLSLPTLDPVAAVAKVSSDPASLLQIFMPIAQTLLQRFSARIESQLKLDAAAVVTLRATLNQRIYIPVLTELLEMLVLDGQPLSHLTLVTLLAGAAYNFTYKAAKQKSHGPTRGAPPPVPSVALSFAPEQVSVLSLPAEASLGLSMTQSVLQMLSAFVFGSAGKPLDLLAGLLGIPLSLAGISGVKRYWPSETLTFLAGTNCLLIDTVAGQTPLGQTTCKVLATTVCVTALVTGIGMLSDGSEPPDISALRMTAELASGIDSLGLDPSRTTKKIAAVAGLALALNGVVHGP